MVTAQQYCAFVFPLAKSRFSNDATQTTAHCNVAAHLSQNRRKYVETNIFRSECLCLVKHIYSIYAIILGKRVNGGTHAYRETHVDISYMRIPNETSVS